MSEIKKIEEEYDFEILKLLELEMLECRKLKKIRLKIQKKEILERFYAKNIHSEIKELKEIETKLEELEIKILRKRYKNESRGFKTLTEQEIELVEKKTKRRSNRKV